MLDEPFSGLDPVAVDVVVQVLKDRAIAGAPVLFSSHQLDIVERLCDDLVIIADGRDPRRRAPATSCAPSTRPCATSWSPPATLGWLGDEPGVEVRRARTARVAVFDVADDATVQRVLRSRPRAAATSSTSRAGIRPSPQIFKEVIR